VISNKKIDSEYNFDLLGNVTQSNPTFLREVDIRTNSDLGTAVGKFDSRNRTVWSHSPTRDTGDKMNRTQARAMEHGVRMKRSTVVTKSDVNIIAGNSAKNEVHLRTRKLIVSNENINYFGALLQKRSRRTTRDDNGTTMTEENSRFEPNLHSDAASSDTNGDRDPEQCLAPEYIVYTWVLCLVALATALKLNYLVKTTLASAMVSVFTTLILVAYRDIFVEQ
jgi:hypothetical protein